jgi:acyl carrier protein
MSSIVNSDTLNDDLARRILVCVRKLLPRAQAKQPILAAHRLRWELGLDSMKLLELVFLLEEEFDWHPADSDFGTRPIETVADLIDLVARALATRGNHETEGSGASPV